MTRTDQVKENGKWKCLGWYCKQEKEKANELAN